MRPLLAALGLLLAAGALRGAPPAKPNIIVILIDDMGWRDLRCTGAPFHDTPNIDALARAGVRFTQAYAACPVCSPTRASILTGRYPARLHLTDWLPGRPDRPDQKLLRPRIRQQLPLEEVTLAEALKPLGYTSASIGKWHLGGEGFGPAQQGFDLNIGGTQAGSPPGGYFKFKTPTLTLREGEYLTDRLSDEAVGFIDRNHDRPFFLYLANYAVHIPLQARKDLLARYEAKPKPKEGPDNPVYAAMVASVDDGVGRIVKKLAERELTEKTLILFTSDNGGLSVKEGPNTPATKNAPLRAGKGYLYEGGIRVPLLLTWPGTVEPGVCDVPVSSVDFFPTLLELAGGKPDPKVELDGVSVVPLLKGAKKLERDALYWHYPHYSNQGGRPGGAIRSGRHKLIEHYEDGKLELFDLTADPGETKDLATKEPAVAASLHKKLAAWRAAMKAQMPTPNPGYRPAGKGK